jgi:hypothetical protein
LSREDEAGEEYTENQEFDCVSASVLNGEIETESTGRDHSVAATVYASQPLQRTWLPLLQAGPRHPIVMTEYESARRCLRLHLAHEVFSKANGRLIKFATKAHK